MELKSSAEKKKHLGGILRIFAKSVRDVAKSLSIDDLRNSEDKLSLSSSQECSTAENTGQKEGKKTHKTTGRYDSRTRSNSENEKLLSSDDHVHNREHKLEVSKTVSLDNLEHQSKAGKENQRPSVAADMEDWGSDLLDVETSSCHTLPTNGSEHQKDTSNSLAGAKSAIFQSKPDLTMTVKSEVKQRAEVDSAFCFTPDLTQPDVKTKKITGGHRHDYRRRRKSLSKGSSGCDPETQPVLGKGKESLRNHRTTPPDKQLNTRKTCVPESVRDAGRMLKHLHVKCEDEKRGRQASVVGLEHLRNTERGDRFTEEKRNIPISFVKPQLSVSNEKKDPFKARKREVLISVVKSDHPCRKARRNSTNFLLPLDEDWSSELLDTSSCSSITSKDELNEPADNVVSQQNVSLVSKEKTEKLPNQILAAKDTDDRPALISNTAYSDVCVVDQRSTVIGHVDDGLYSDETAGREAHSDECDSLDITFNRTGDEDWSTDLMSVPSSKNASPQAPEKEDARLIPNVGPETRKYLPLNTDNLSPLSCLRENTSHFTDSEREYCSEVDLKRIVTNFKEKVDNDPQENSDSTAAIETVDTEDVLGAFVDDISDIASDHEQLSDLESQAPSTLELISANDTICSSDVADSCDFMTQDEDYDHFPTFCAKYQSHHRHDLHDKEKVDVSMQAGRFLQCYERKEACSTNETTCDEKMYENRREQEDKTTSQRSSASVKHYPLLRVPLETVQSRESVERLMNYIDNHMQNISLAPTRRQDTKNVWFNIERNYGRDELNVGFECQHEHVSPMYPSAAYPWAWPCNPWTTYPDTAYPRYDLCDPCLSPNTAYYNHYFERFCGDCQRDYLYPYKDNREGLVHKMPSDEQHLFHQQFIAGENRIVDYDSSSEDERLAMLASKHGLGKSYGKQTATAEKKSYASCVMNNSSSKRSLLSDTQGDVGYPLLKKDKVVNMLGNKMQRLGVPKQARVLETCHDRNREIASDPSAMHELSRSDRSDGKHQVFPVEHAKNFCEQSKPYSGGIFQRSAAHGSEENESWKSGPPDPKLWAQFRRNKNIIDSFDLDDSFETNSGKENVEDEISDEEEVKSPGCYPYLTIGKVIGKTKENSRKSDGNTASLLNTAQWAAWGTEKNHVFSKPDVREQAKKNVNQTEDCNSSVDKSKSLDVTPEDTDERRRLSIGQMSSPPVMPVCQQPFWGDPRMAFPYPPYYPSHWVPGFPGAFSPGYLPYQSPPNTPAPTSTPASSTSTTAPRSTTASFPYQMTQYATSRSRTVSAPPTEVDKMIRMPGSVGEDKSCKNYFLSGKNRRVSDSALRSDTQIYTPKRSSYASRLQNDARLNANFPQLDWKIRFKSRCRNYAYSFIDSHCHLDFLYHREGFKGTFAKYMLKHEDTFPDNFEGCVAVFCNPATFLPYGGLWKDLANENKVWLTMGCHPKMVTDFDTVAVEGLKTCIQDPRVIAVGEIGLDYSGTFRQHEELQKKMFAFQLQLALDVKKPLVIHCRQAEEDCLAIMEQIVPRNYKIHCHCFTGSYQECQKWLNKFPNLYIGLTNLVSFRSASPTHDVARHISLSRLLLETDTPYFLPRQIPKGEFELSHPGMAIFVAEEIARIKQVSVNTVLKACRNNTKDMYGV